MPASVPAKDGETRPEEATGPRICDPAKGGDALRNLRHEDERRRGQ